MCVCVCMCVLVQYTFQSKPLFVKAKNKSSMKGIENDTPVQDSTATEVIHMYTRVHSKKKHTMCDVFI